MSIVDFAERRRWTFVQSASVNGTTEKSSDWKSGPTRSSSACKERRCRTNAVACSRLS
jgi:hypothetical protein